MAPCTEFLVSVPASHGWVLGREFERGNMMLEAVIGLAVGAILGLAMAWGAAQAMHSQRFSTAQSTVVFAMRQKLSVASAPVFAASAASAQSTVTTLNVPIGGVGVTLTGVTTCQPPVAITMAVGGSSSTVNYRKPCTLSTNSGDAANKSVVGGDGVIQF